MNQGDSPKIEARTSGSVALRDREAWKERWPERLKKMMEKRCFDGGGKASTAQ